VAAGDNALSRSASAPFSYYLGTVGASSAAIGLQNILYPWLVVSYLGLDGQHLGLAQMATMVPHLLLILLGGALSANRRLSGYLSKLYLLYLLPFAALIVLVQVAELRFWQLTLFGCAFGVVSAFIQPAREALLPQVSSRGMQQNVAKIALVQFSAQTLGMLAAGFFEVVGLQSLLMIQGGLFVAASLLVRRTLSPEVGGRRETGKRESIRAGVAMVWGHPNLRPLMALVAATGFLGIGAYVVVVPVLAKEIYGLDAIYFAAMQLCFTLGVLASNLGLMGMARGFRRPGRLLLLSLLLRGGLIASLALLPPLWLTMPMLVAWGVLSGLSMTLGRTLAHEEAAGDYLSRVMSIYQLSLLGSAPLGAGFAGVITGQFGVDGTLVVLGGLTVVAAVAGIAGSGLWRLSRWAP